MLFENTILPRPEAARAVTVLYPLTHCSILHHSLTDFCHMSNVLCAVLHVSNSLLTLTYFPMAFAHSHVTFQLYVYPTVMLPVAHAIHSLPYCLMHCPVPYGLVELVHCPVWCVHCLLSLVTAPLQLAQASGRVVRNRKFYMGQKMSGTAQDSRQVVRDSALDTWWVARSTTAFP